LQGKIDDGVIIHQFATWSIGFNPKLEVITKDIPSSQFPA
jgi:hypothetical protein